MPGSVPGPEDTKSLQRIRSLSSGKLSSSATACTQDLVAPVSVSDTETGPRRLALDG